MHSITIFGRMNSEQPFDLVSFRDKARLSTRRMRRFLTRLEDKPPKAIDRNIAEMEKDVWKEVNCLSCANCCKTMTPTFTVKDIKRIAAHLEMTPDSFKEKYLRRERGGDRDWMNKTEPCQFLNLDNNMCSIYEVRPADCAGFPHIGKKFVHYGHIHKQNIEWCPATHKLVEKMMEALR
jgi:Fe-S-cluster containining protein